MIRDCAVIGGGPAGLNAALVLGRSRRNTIVFDDNRPRNAVTTESHGFITRDGIDPNELRELASKELDNYPDVELQRKRVKKVTKKNQIFTIETDDEEVYQARKVILAAGLKEKLPNIPSIHRFYGTSLFSCPFCDGWELRDRPLVVIVENEHSLHLAKLVYNWTHDLIISTNGSRFLSNEEKKVYQEKGIRIYEQKIASLMGENGFLKNILFEDGTTISREGGFVVPEMEQASSIGLELGCELNNLGAIQTDGMGRTTVEGVFACGDTSIIAPSQLIIAAAEGSKAAIGVNASFIQEDF